MQACAVRLEGGGKEKVSLYVEGMECHSLFSYKLTCCLYFSCRVRMIQWTCEASAMQGSGLDALLWPHFRA